MADQNLVQITLRGKDELSAILRQVQQLLGDVGKQQQQSSRQMTQAVSQSTEAWRQFGNVFQGLGIATGVSAITAAVVGLGKSVVEVGVKIEGMRASLVATSGSVQAGERTFRFLLETSNRLGVDVLSAADAFKSLQAATRGTSVEGQQTQQIFTAIAGAIKVTGGSSEQLGRALTALQQIISKGTVSSEELRGQLGEALPGAFQIAARAMGVTTAELGKMLEQGKLLSTDFIMPFVRQLSTEFGPGVVAATDTAGSAFARLANEITLAKNQIASSGLLGTLKDIANAGADALKTRREFAEQEAKAVGGTPPVLPSTAGSLMQARQDQINRFRESLRLDKTANIQPDTFAEREAQIRMLVENQRKAIAEQQTALLAEGAGPGSTGPSPLSATEDRVQKLFEEGRENLSKIDLDRTLTTDIARAEEKLKEWDKTIKSVVTELNKLSQPLMKDLSPFLETQIKKINELRETLVAEVDLDKEMQETRKQTMDIGREETQRMDERQRKEQDVLRTLQESARAYEMTTAERERYSAAQLAAQFPANAEIQAAAKQAIALSETAEAYQEARARVQEFARAGDLLGLEVAPSVEKARKEQEDYNKVLEETLLLLRTPRAERTSERVRQMAPGGIQTAQQEMLNAAILAQERANTQAKEMENIARDVARGIESTFLQMWDSVFSGGVKSFRDFALLSLQGIQRLLGQVSGQLISQLLGRALGGSSSESGLSGLLAGILVKVGLGLFPGGAGAGTGSAVLAGGSGGGGGGAPGFANGGIVGSLQSLRSVGFQQRGIFRGFQPLAMAMGGVVSQPSMAMIGEGRFNEAVVPLPDGRSIPVAVNGGNGPMSGGPFVVELHQSFDGAIDPRTLRTSRNEVTQWVIEDVSKDGPMRRVINQYAR